MKFSLRLFLIVCFVAAPQLASTFAQVTNGPISADLADAQLRAGKELEQSRQWLEAIQHYEVVIKQFPDHLELKRRLLIARLHYDVQRRCQDVTMVEDLRKVRTEEALDLYSEVLARLEMSYVDTIDMTQIVRGGTAYLEVALTEPKFIELFAQGRDASTIEQFRTSIHRLTLAKPINGRADARAIVTQAAAVAEHQIGLEPTMTVMQFVFGAVGLLDPYSSFLSASELSEVESQIEGNFVGLGIALQPHQVPLQVLNVIPNGPASEAGIEPGDRILEVGSVRCEDVGAERAADLLRGPEQSHVRLLIARRDGTTLERVVARRRVEVPSIENVKMIDPVAGAAYLKISSFQKTTATELDEALWSLQRQGMQSLIIDLRGNPGGWLDAAVAVADRFVNEGGIVSTRGKNGIENQTYRASKSGTWQVPLFVLIDHESASASEILAGAIRDNRRGLLIGTTSYGKGSVQGLFHTKNLSSGIRLTVSKFYSPSGMAISERGVQPNIIVEGPSRKDREHFVAKPIVSKDPNEIAALMTSEDPVLRTGIEHARNVHRTANR